MFIDMHVHTGGISCCCKGDYKEMLNAAKGAGFDGVVICNHYTKAYFTDENYDEWIEKYIDEYYKCRDYGKEIGLKTFFGIEVTYDKEPIIHFLIYGADKEFLRNNKFLCDKTQEELYKICKESNCQLVQAHPFRYGATVKDTDFLDGIEINCHPKYQNSYSEEIVDIAKKKDLFVTVGCDYHADTKRAEGGMFLPDDIETNKEFSAYLAKKEKVMLRVHEPKDDTIKKIFVNE